MVLKQLKKEWIAALHAACGDFAIYGETVRQNFRRPCMVVRLEKGEIFREGKRSRITAVFRLCIFGEEEDQQFDRLGEIAWAAEQLSAACTGLTFAEQKDYLEAEVTFVLRGQLTAMTHAAMYQLTEELNIG